MFRSLLSIAAAAAAMTGFASAAQACISCEYVPEVVREHSTLNSKPHRAKMYVAAPKLRNRPAPVVKAAPRRIETASISKSPPAPKAKTVKLSESTPDTKSEAVRPASVALLKTETEADARETEAQSEGAAAVAETPNAEVQTAEAKPVDEKPELQPNDNVGCRKFIPAVGVTLSIACD